jgi:hypothetical protein
MQNNRVDYNLTFLMVNPDDINQGSSCPPGTGDFDGGWATHPLTVPPVSRGTAGLPPYPGDGRCRLLAVRPEGANHQ